MDNLAKFKGDFGFFTPVDYNHQGYKKSVMEHVLEFVDDYFYFGGAIARSDGEFLEVAQLSEDEQYWRNPLVWSYLTLVIPALMFVAKVCLYPIRQKKISHLTCLRKNHVVGKMNEIYNKQFHKKINVELDTKKGRGNVVNADFLGLNNDCEYNMTLNGESFTFTINDVINDVVKEINRAVRKNLEEDFVRLSDKTGTCLGDYYLYVHGEPEPQGDEGDYCVPIPSKTYLLPLVFEAMVEKKLIDKFRYGSSEYFIHF